MNNITFSDKQIEVIKYNNTHYPKILILEGAIRTGKTLLNMFFFYDHVYSFKDMNVKFIITGYTISSIKKNVLDDFASIFNVNTTLNINNEFKLHGNTVCCFGTDKADSYKSMRGLTAFGWLGNEVTLSHENSIDQAFKRCSGQDSRIFWDTNPSYPEHNIKVNFIDKSEKELINDKPFIKSFNFVLDDATFLDPNYVKMIKSTTPEGVYYDRDINGIWAAREGIVYKAFKKDVNVIKPFELNKNYRRYRAIDFGYNNPFVCLWFAVDDDNIIYVYSEHYESQKLLDYHADMIKIRNENYVATIADHDAQDNAELRKLGIYTINANKDILEGIRKVEKRLMQNEKGKSGLYIFDTCINLIKEFGLYRYQDKKENNNNSELPIKENDHALDALRYFINYIDNNNAPNVRVI